MEIAIFSPEEIFFEGKGLWNVMGLHYTVNSSTSKKILALGSSFWRGLRNFGYVFAIFCTRQLVSKNVLHYVTEEYVLVL